MQPTPGRSPYKVAAGPRRSSWYRPLTPGPEGLSPPRGSPRGPGRSNWATALVLTRNLRRHLDAAVAAALQPGKVRQGRIRLVAA